MKSNSKLGFLLRFKVDPDIGEAILRTFPKKAGKSDEIFLPLILEQVADSKEQFRVTFMVFPRDLIQETSRKSMERGLKFMPPYALHQGSENQNTFSKLLIQLNQRFREDEKPDEEKLKSETLKASVDKRIADRKGTFKSRESTGCILRPSGGKEAQGGWRVGPASTVYRAFSVSD